MPNRALSLLLILLLGCLGLRPVADVPVVQRPLADKCSRPRTAADNVTHLMVHFCSDAIQNPQAPFSVDRITQIFEEVGVSAHYLVGRDGTIYQLVAEDRVAFHAGKGKLPFEPYYENSLNAHSIGIELMAVGSKKDMKMFFSEAHHDQIDRAHIGFTEAQYTALAQLTADILRRHPGIKKDRRHIVGHDEYAPARRTDPGELFDWKKIGL
jgi:N-acetyl-anhydromuramyl-L-alanine amidase AmpD